MWTVAACDCRDVKQVVYRESRRPHTCRVRESTVPGQLGRAAPPTDCAVHVTTRSAACRLYTLTLTAECIQVAADASRKTQPRGRLLIRCTANSLASDCLGYTFNHSSSFHSSCSLCLDWNYTCGRLDVNWGPNCFVWPTRSLITQSWLSRLQQQLNDTVFSHDCCVLYLLCKLSS